jgi:hypothetical protein
MVSRTLAATLVALTFALSACSALNIKRGVSDEDIAKTKRVGVVSLLGNDFQGVLVGSTVFGNNSFSTPVPDWKIDKTATEETLSLLRRNTRYESDAVGTGGQSIDELKANESKKLWEAAERQKFDRLVILRPGVSSNDPFFKPSYGYYERSFFGSLFKCIYAAYIVDVYDVATKRPIAWEWGGEKPCERKYEGSLEFRGAFDKYSKEEKAALKKGVEDRLRESLLYALQELSLVPRKPAP